jgi:hypothetical protein
MRFAAVYREKNSLKGGVETMKIIGAAWKGLGDAEKKPFLDIAANDRRIYQKKFEEYKQTGKLDAWKRDPAKPKKPNTAFLEWSVERRKDPQFSKMAITESSKLIAVEWKSIPQAQKDALQAKAKSKLETYKQEMQAYKASGKEEVWLERTGRLAAAKKAEEKALKQKTQETAAKEKEKAKVAKEKEKLKLQSKKEKEVKAKAAAKKKADMETLKTKKHKEAAKKKTDMEKLKAKKAREVAAAKNAKEVAAAKKTKEVAAAKKAKDATRAKEVAAKEKAKALKMTADAAKSKDTALKAKVAKAKVKSKVLGAS